MRKWSARSRPATLTTLPVGLCLSGALALGAASCNNSRVGEEYTDSEDGGLPPTPTYDLYGRDLARPRNRDAACASVKAEATLTKKPVDVIFVIDNSGSMSDEILAVQNNINTNFASIIGKSGLDYHVIMLASHGNAASAQKVCVSKPLSTIDCTPVPARPGDNPPIFYHYSRNVQSTDSFQRILGSIDGREKDEFGRYTTGWLPLLRTDAYKAFIEITDDESSTTWTAFDTQLVAKSPAQFGSTAMRNYVWHSIIGVKENNPATKPWGPMDPLQTTKCTRGGGAVGPGTEYQKLSIATGGLRFPICEHASFDAVFNAIAMGVIAGAKVACDFKMPEAPAGEKIDPDSIIVEYTPMGTGSTQAFKKVKDVAACSPGSFYIDNNRINLCPDSCQLVQSDSAAKVQVLFDCLSIIG